MHKHLIKRLSKIIKKERRVYICWAPRRPYFRVYCDVRERWFLAWNQNKHNIYYIFHILIPESVLVFHAFAPTSFYHCSFTTAQLLVRDLPTSILVLAVISLLTFHKSIILAPLWFDVFRAKQISDPFPSTIHTVLLTRFTW